MDNPKIFKESVSTERSHIFDCMIRQIKSRFLISHVIKRSIGSKGIENTHPFEYGNWIFAHNASINIKDLLKEQLLPKFTKLIEGDTDSEVFFFLIVQSIGKKRMSSKTLKIL